MPNKYQAVITSDEAEAARELIVELLGKFPKGLNARELGLQLDMSGYTISHIMRPLTKSGKVIRNCIGKNKSIYTLPVHKPSTPTPANPPAKTHMGNRHMVVFKREGRWVAEVLVTEAAAMKLATTIADENLDTPVFYGKATRRVCTPKPKTNVEEI